jgi:hypothetical protein
MSESVSISFQNKLIKKICVLTLPTPARLDASFHRKAT